jgi:hypothetical protein
MNADPITDAEWGILGDAIPRLPPGVDIERVRREIEAIKQEFAGFPRFDLSAARKKWTRYNKLTAELAAATRELKVKTPWDADDPMWPNRLLDALWPAKQKAECQLEGLAVIAHARKAGWDSPQAWLHWRLVCFWIDVLGGTFTVTDHPGGGPPSGPAIDFLTAAVFAISEKTASPHTLRAALHGERDRRKGICGTKK